MASDPLGDIELKEADSYGKGVVNSVPVLGSGVKTFEAAAGVVDGDATAGDVQGLATEGAGFVQSCADVVGAVGDPLAWLVGNGLNFLLAVVQPLQDALHFVTGDGPALSNAAESFNNIGQGLQKFGQQFAEQAQTSLAEWKGEASETAGGKLGEFASGINGTAAKAGDISQLLQISSMIMTVIEEFIKGLITEFVTFLIELWVPALAAAVPTAGASTAAAGSATGVRAGMTATRTTRQVGKLQKLLDLIKDLLTKLKSVFARTKGKIGDGFLNSAGTRNLARAEQGVAKTILDGGTKAVKEQFTKPGNLAGNLDKASKADQAGAVGEEQSTEETSGKLDF